MKSNDNISLKSESPYVDHMVRSIVFAQYETMPNLRKYSVEEFLALFEIIYVKNANKAIAFEIARGKMGK